MSKFSVGDLCHHPQFGLCRVTLLDQARGLVQVRWPENGASYVYWSLVKPETLTKQENALV